MRKIDPNEKFVGERCTLRLVTLDDCTERYLAWLEDPAVNRMLETRWTKQTLEGINQFVSSMLASSDSYLFAIISNAARSHVGNIKLGPIHARHSFADVSYFIGERAEWGKGIASEAIALVSGIGFERFDLHRVQAGLYASNTGSARALEKAGFTREGSLRRQLRGPDETWEDHVWYGLLREEWAERQSAGRNQ
jgi:RimJ/RimL family protein N-acetyltransferase